MKKIFTILFIVSTSSLFAQFDAPESAVYDLVNSRYYISNANSGTITSWKYGTVKTFASGLIQPKAMLILDSTLYVCDYTTIKTYNCNTAQPIDNVTVPGATYMNDMCVDSAGNFYITETYDNSIIKYTKKTKTYSKLPLKGSIEKPNGIILDGNRLIIVSFRPKAPIQAISLKDFTVTTLKTTDLDYMDGIQKDGKGNVFFSAWINNTTGSGKVFKMKEDFSGDSTVVVTNLDGPADIYYNQLTDTLVIPCMNGSSVFFISFLDPPPAPKLKFPPNGTKNSGLILLQWTKPRGAENYDVQISKQSSFDVTLLALEVSDTTFIFTTDKMCDTLYWRVRAKNSKGVSPWSEVRTLAPIEPNPQKLVAPPDKMTDAPFYVTLKWNSNNTNAKIIIDTNSNFQTKKEYEHFLDTTYIVGPLLSKTTYYWKIIGITCNKEAESEVRSFTTIDASLPDKPMLTKPDSGAKDIDAVQPTFEWNSGGYTDYYRFWIGYTDDFMYFVVYDSVPAGSSATMIHKIKDTLNYDTPYFWKVVAHNKYGSTESDVKQFRTVKYTGVEEEKNSISISPNPASDYIEINVPRWRGQGVDNSDGVSVRIFDLLGTEYTTLSLRDTPPYQGGEIRIDVSALQPGVYFVRASDVVRKFVKL